MFKANLVDINEKLEEMVINPIYVNMSNDNLKRKNIDKIYINPWKVIRDYVAASKKI